MTYGIGIKLKSGLVMISDSRTNAGVDHISTFRKMKIWEEPGGRVMILLSAGNLAITQTVVTLLDEGVEDRETGQIMTIAGAPGMLRAAQLVGSAVREVHRVDAEMLKLQGLEFNAAFILGGQVKGRQVRLFLIYSAGNFIEATDDTPFFQIGETKYGKPILDRLLTSAMSLEDAAKLALISMDSTLRSNISVGLPVDLVIYEADSLRITRQRTFDENDTYFRQLRRHWSRGLARAFKQIPGPTWQ